MPAKNNEVRQAIARIQSGILALVFGLVFGIGLFTMTVWLILKGGPNIGTHLQLLSHYFIGYSVSWPGSLLGFLYGGFLGGIIGWSIGRLYNRIVCLRLPNRLVSDNNNSSVQTSALKDSRLTSAQGKAGD